MNFYFNASMIQYYFLLKKLQASSTFFCKFTIYVKKVSIYDKICHTFLIHLYYFCSDLECMYAYNIVKRTIEDDFFR